MTTGAYSDGGHAPNRRLSGFFTEKTGFVGTVLSTKSVLWTSNMPKMRWRPGIRPNPAGGAYDAPPEPLVGWGEGHPLPNPNPSRRLWRLDSRAFGAQLLCPPM